MRQWLVIQQRNISRKTLHHILLWRICYLGICVLFASQLGIPAATALLACAVGVNGLLDTLRAFMLHKKNDTKPNANLPPSKQVIKNKGIYFVICIWAACTLCYCVLVLLLFNTYEKVSFCLHMFCWWFMAFGLDFYEVLLPIFISDEKQMLQHMPHFSF